MPKSQGRKLKAALTFDELLRALESRSLLGQGLLGPKPAPVPPRYDEGISGKADWRDDQIFVTHRHYAELIKRQKFKPKLAVMAKPKANKFWPRWQLPPKESFNSVAELQLTAEDAFYLSCGHEMSHRLAWQGGWRGIRIAFAEVGELAPFATPLVLAPVLGADLWLTVGLSAVGIIVSACFYWLNRVSETGKPTYADKKGWWCSYAREELVAEIGAAQIFAQFLDKNVWPSYSIGYIANWLSNIDAPLRLRVLRAAYEQATARISSITMPVSNS